MTMQNYYQPHIFKKFETKKKLRIIHQLTNYIYQHPPESSDIVGSSHFQKLEEYIHGLENINSEIESRTKKTFQRTYNSIRSTDDLNLKLNSISYFLLFLERMLDLPYTEENDIYSFRNDKSSRTQLPINILCDQIRSAHNLGSIIRTSECFAVKNIYIHKLSPRFDHPSVKKTSMNLEKFLTISEYENFEKFYSENHQKFHFIALEKTKNSTSINNEKFKNEIAKIKNGKEVIIVVGNEQYGIMNKYLELMNQVIHIPLYGAKNSLNVVHALSIALHEITKILCVESGKKQEI